MKRTRLRLRGIPKLYRYFRGAEYPMGRAESLWQALRTDLYRP